MCRRRFEGTIPAGGEDGVILLALVVIVILILGVTGSVMVVSIEEARALEELRQHRSAFYLAEGGLEGGKWEIGEKSDPDGNGPGNRGNSTADGTCSVLAEDLGGGTYRLTSTATSGQSSVTLQEVIATRVTTRFPPGATTVVGSPDKEKLRFRKDFGLIMDGGDSPAFCLTDREVHDHHGSRLAEAVVKGDLPRANLTGTPDGAFESKGQKVEIPVVLETDYPEILEDLSGLYTQLVDTVNRNIIPTAQVFTAATRTEDGKTDAGDRKSGGARTDEYSFGSKKNPATVYMPGDVSLESGEKISGHGTLVIGDQLTLEQGSTLDWNGSVIVMGDTHRKAILQVDGAFHVTGNVVVLGEAREKAEFKVGDDATARIDGSFLAGTNFTDKGKEVQVTMDGELTVNGLFTMIGQKVSTRFKNDSDFSLNGMLQLAIPESHRRTKLEFAFDGHIEIHRDDDMIQKAAAALAELGALWDISRMGDIVKTRVTTCSWRQVTN